MFSKYLSIQEKIYTQKIKKKIKKENSSGTFGTKKIKDGSSTEADDINQEEANYLGVVKYLFLKCQQSTCTIKNNYLYWKDLHFKISDY